MKTCPHCNHQNEKNHTVCRKCFRPLPGEEGKRTEEALDQRPQTTDRASLSGPQSPASGRKRLLNFNNLAVGIVLLAFFGYLCYYFLDGRESSSPVERALRMLPQRERGYGYISATYINFREFRKIYGSDPLPRSLIYLLQPLNKIGIQSSAIEELYFWNHKHPSAIAVGKFSPPDVAGRIRALGYATRNRKGINWFYKAEESPSSYAIIKNRIYYGEQVNNLLRVREDAEMSMLNGEPNIAALRKHIKYSSFIVIGNEYVLPLGWPRPNLCVSGRLLAPDKARIHFVAEFDGPENALKTLQRIRAVLAARGDSPDSSVRGELIEHQLMGNILSIEFLVQGDLDVFTKRLLHPPFN